MEVTALTVPQDKAVYARYILEKSKERMTREAERGVPHADGSDVTPTSLALMEREEVGSIKEMEDKGWTGFHADNDGPFLYNYSVKGFMCEAARTMKEAEAEGVGADPDEETEAEETEAEAEETEDKKPAKKKPAKKKPGKKASGVLKQLQDKTKRYVFVFPRRIRLPAPEWDEETGRYKFQVNERPLRAMTAMGPRVTVTRSDIIPAGTQLTFFLVLLHGSGLTRGILTDCLEYGMFMGLGQWRSGGWGAFAVDSFEEANWKDVPTFVHR